MPKKRKKDGAWNTFRVILYAMMFSVTLGVITALLAWATDGQSVGQARGWGVCVFLALIPPAWFHWSQVR